MGMDVDSHAIIGLRISPASRFYTTKLAKVGKHDHPNTVKFCSQTGKPLWREVEVPFLDEDDENCEGIFVYHPDSEGKNSPFIIVGKEFGTSPEGSYGNKHPTATRAPTDREINAIRNHVIAQVPKNLFDESQFGLWSMTSYCY
jgi:hypothetical protein